MSSEKAPLLSLNAVSSRYGRIHALHDVTLSVKAGSIVALVGANGAGKSTLLKVISGVHPASSGTLQFEGAELSKMKSSARVKSGICHAPEGRQVFGAMTIEENLELGGYVHGGATEAEVADIYEMFPVLREKRSHPAASLSGGQQQMLAIGRALMGRPKLLLLDEPGLGLAPLLIKEVFATISSLKQRGITVLLIEQNAAAALSISDAGYVLESGRIVLSGSGKELLKSDTVRKAYLGM